MYSIYLKKVLGETIENLAILMHYAFRVTVGGIYIPHANYIKYTSRKAKRRQ